MSENIETLYDKILNEIIDLERNYAVSDRNISTQRQNEIKEIIQKYTNSKNNNETWYSRAT